MVHLEHIGTANTTDINNDQLNIVLDALEHEMLRYNEALVTISEKAAAAAIRAAVVEIGKVHHKLCLMMDENYK